jgi:hypothetical protein
MNSQSSIKGNIALADMSMTAYINKGRSAALWIEQEPTIYVIRSTSMDFRDILTVELE